MNKSMNKLILGIFFITACVPFQLKAQELSRAERNADSYVESQRFDKAVDAYNSVLSKSSDKGTQNRVNLKMATMFYDIRRYNDATRCFDAVYPNITKFNNKQAAKYISALVRTNQANRAAEVAKEFTNSKAFSTDVPLLNLERGIKYLNEQAEGVTISKAPFSKEGSSFWCTDLDNGVLFLNTGITERELLKGARFFYYNGSQTSEYNKVEETLQAGPATFSSDRTTMLYTDNRYGSKAPNRLKSQKLVNNNLMIVELKYNSKKQSWDNPTELFKNKADFSFCHPALSKDGNVLYFASNMGNKSMDLYMSRRSGNGWSEPVSLGDAVNTKGEEVFPSVYDDYLIFSSNGLDGFGGQDLYAIQLSSNGLPVAGTLQHLPPPINGVYNDYALMNEGDKRGYFSSDRPDGSNMDAIYLWEQDQTVAATIMAKKEDSPMLANPNEVKPVPVAQVVPTPEPTPTPTVTTPTPAYTSPYTNAKPSMHAMSSEEVANGLADGTYHSDVTVYFDFDRSSLTLAGRAALNDFYNRYVKGEYSSKLIVVGYTDVIGTNEKNLILSKRRANAVKEFLVNKGVSASSIEIFGKGKLTLTKDQELESRSVRERLAPARKADVKIMIAD